MWKNVKGKHLTCFLFERIWQWYNYCTRYCFSPDKKKSRADLYFLVRFKHYGLNQNSKIFCETIETEAYIQKNGRLDCSTALYLNPKKHTKYLYFFDKRGFIVQKEQVPAWFNGTATEERSPLNAWLNVLPCLVPRYFFRWFCTFAWRCGNDPRAPCFSALTP